MPAKKTTATKKTSATKKTTRKSESTAKAAKAAVLKSESDVVTITEKVRNDTPAAALSDRASDAREYSTKSWSSGLGKYAG
ncbi:MAG: RNA polymerase sigma factor, partial [Merismopedia sp. SIO2A8]|nr:RNA polymerase sigma factor [Merismopedia sp. SIO2A8]